MVACHLVRGISENDGLLFLISATAGQFVVLSLFLLLFLPFLAKEYQNLVLFKV